KMSPFFLRLWIIPLPVSIKHSEGKKTELPSLYKPFFGFLDGVIFKTYKDIASQLPSLEVFLKKIGGLHKMVNSLIMVIREPKLIYP
ncbi:unnamed protein product, partial [marine sediment metagenome]